MKYGADINLTVQLREDGEYSSAMHISRSIRLEGKTLGELESVIDNVEKFMTDNTEVTRKCGDCDGAGRVRQTLTAVREDSR